MSESFFQEMTLFTAGAGGYATYRIPGIVVTAKYTLLAYCEARKSGRGDWGAIDILLRRSVDGGQTWEEPRQVAKLATTVPKNPVALAQALAGADEQTYNNPVAIAGQETGVVHLLFCVEYARCFYVRSDDDGRSFSAPQEITTAFEGFRSEYDWQVIATGPGHGIQLRSGRLLAPVWLSTGTGGHAHRPSVVAVIYSDDAGASWQRGEIAAWDTETAPNPSETAAVELSDGRVLLNIRNESVSHRRLLSYSNDGVSGWSEPIFNEALFEPVCFASMVRLTLPPPATNPILFVNPDSRSNPHGLSGQGKWPRENLTIRASYDEGKTWPVARVIDPGVAGYADLAAGPDGAIYCLYEGGSVAGDMYHNAFIKLVRFNLAWLREAHASV